MSKYDRWTKQQLHDHIKSLQESLTMATDRDRRQAIDTEIVLCMRAYWKLGGSLADFLEFSQS